MSRQHLSTQGTSGDRKTCVPEIRQYKHHPTRFYFPSLAWRQTWGLPWRWPSRPRQCCQWADLTRSCAWRHCI